MAALVSAVVFPNVCIGFIFMLFCSVFAVSLKVQFPRMEVLAKLSDSHFSEENRWVPVTVTLTKFCQCNLITKISFSFFRYEGDCLDTPLRIIRLSGPLLSVNCESVRAELFKQAVVVKGLVIYWLIVDILKKTFQIDRNRNRHAYRFPPESMSISSWAESEF